MLQAPLKKVKLTIPSRNASQLAPNDKRWTPLLENCSLATFVIEAENIELHRKNKLASVKNEMLKRCNYLYILNKALHLARMDHPQRDSRNLKIDDKLFSIKLSDFKKYIR